MADDEWTEGKNRNGKRSLIRKSGIVCIRLEQVTMSGTKFHSEVELHGCVVQTGTYRGTLEEVKEKSYSDACTLFERAIQELSESKKTGVPSEG